MAFSATSQLDQVDFRQQQQHFGAPQPPQAPGGPQQMHTGGIGAADYAPSRGDAGSTNPETVRRLHDYNLLAEAAKRAQVACMIRDMDDMDMS
jgi:hypothetical protein